MKNSKGSDEKPEDSDEKMEGRSNDSDPASQSPAEWISFLVASAILVSVLGTVIYLWVRDRSSQPPELAVTSTIETRQGKYYVPFTVTNSGDETAAAVQIIAELKIDGVVVEWGEQTIDFLSSQEEKKGAFIFTHEPHPNDLTVRTASYQEP